ncbi:MAG: hypothetical protein M9927_24855, partial [Anaerolineae bacterium]|nr:hypothetical protein [Anaerolineae bacterium]
AASYLGQYGFPEDEIYAIYSTIDFEAVIADLQTFSTENFASDLPDMSMPILLLVGSQDGDKAALMAAADKLPNATFTSLRGYNHTTAYMQTGLVVEQVTKFLAEAGDTP